MTRLTGNPLDVLLDARATEEDRAAVAQVLGLDRPWPAQYVIYLGRLARGDFGDSFKTRQPALAMVLERFPWTLQLGSAAFILSVAIGVPIGIMTAGRKDTAGDAPGMVIGFLGLALP